MTADESLLLMDLRFESSWLGTSKLIDKLPSSIMGSVEEIQRKKDIEATALEGQTSRGLGLWRNNLLWLISLCLSV